MSSSSPNVEPQRAWSKDETDGPDQFARDLQTAAAPMSLASEAFRTLRTNVLYGFVDNPPKVIVVTSPGPREGKSTICANLGVVLAQADRDVLSIDCDFRQPDLHHLFGIRNVRGVMDVLVGERTLPEVWSEPMAGLKVVTVGPTPPNPSEILGTARFSSLLTNIRQGFDYILLDAPPVGMVSDPAILAIQGDGVLLVIDAQVTRKVAVRHAMHSLEAVGANVLGTVMNNVKISKDVYRGYFNYGYGH